MNRERIIWPAVASMLLVASLGVLFYLDEGSPKQPDLVATDHEMIQLLGVCGVVVGKSTTNPDVAIIEVIGPARWSRYQNWAVRIESPRDLANGDSLVFQLNIPVEGNVFGSRPSPLWPGEGCQAGYQRYLP